MLFHLITLILSADSSSVERASSPRSSFFLDSSSKRKNRDGNEPEIRESSRVRVPKSEFLVGFCEFESSRAKRKSVILSWDLEFHRYFFGKALIFKKKSQKQTKIKDFLFFKYIFC